MGPNRDEKWQRECSQVNQQAHGLKLKFNIGPFFFDLPEH